MGIKKQKDFKRFSETIIFIYRIKLLIEAQS